MRHKGEVPALEGRIELGCQPLQLHKTCSRPSHTLANSPSHAFNAARAMYTLAQQLISICALSCDALVSMKRPGYDVPTNGHMTSGGSPELHSVVCDII
jgi:hypothetical protein